MTLTKYDSHMMQEDDTVLRRSILRVIMQKLDQGNVAHWAIFPPAKGSDGEF